ncbi:ATP-binding protein [Shewanella cyperi]|uniref:ATP-binding protein n=1 Tax=Shewanella cyperi TaxID=2814292 RepID=A0A975AJW8_9GAMM|nr:ATP-binding protein [Shewanella cyperi]QSX29757.1 ATP-binding protein [Shewanella cyperi]
MAALALSDLDRLRESVRVEFKLAAGRNGLGQLPEAIWESYSAFANTQGGEIILGVREHEGQFSIQGIAQPEPLVQQIWQILEDRSRISCNLLGPRDVQIVALADKKLIRIHVPEANKTQKPIFLGSSPFGGTYFRVGDADMRASHRQVNRLLRESKHLTPPES